MMKKNCSSKSIFLPSLIASSIYAAESASLCLYTYAKEESLVKATREFAVFWTNIPMQENNSSHSDDMFRVKKQLAQMSRLLDSRFSLRNVKVLRLTFF